MDGAQVVRTAQAYKEQERTLRARALCNVLNRRPWSRRRLSDLLRVDERIVRRLCDGTSPLDERREAQLRADARVVHALWRQELELLLRAAGDERQAA